MERCIWACALVIVAIWGAFREDEASGGKRGPEQAAASKSVARGAGEARPGDVQGRGARSGTKRQRSGTGNAVVRALNREDPLGRMTDFLAVLSTCDQGNLAEIEAVWSNLKATGVKLPAEESLLNYRIGQIKGAEALEGSTGTAKDFASLDLLRSRFDGWIATDPAGAKVWLDGLPEGKFRDQMTLSAIAASARDNPVSALEQVAGLPVHLRQLAGRSVGDRFRESLPLDQGSHLLTDLGAMGASADDAYLEGIFDSLAGAVSQGGDEAVMRLVEGHLDQPYVSYQTLQRLSTEMGKNDPITALERAAEFQKKQGASEGEFLSAAMREMSLSDLEKVETWASEKGGSADTAEVRLLLENRRRILEERGDDENEYDRDD